MPGKAAEDGVGTCDPAIHMGEQESPGPWLWIGLSLAVATIWGANQWVEYLPYPISFSHSACQINKAY